MSLVDTPVIPIHRTSYRSLAKVRSETIRFWNNWLAVLCPSFPMLLGLSIAGISSPQILMYLASALPNMQGLAHVSGPFVDYSGVTSLTRPAAASILVTIALAATATNALTLGAIGAAMQHHSRHGWAARLRSICSACWANARLLIAVSLIRGLAISIGLITLAAVVRGSVLDLGNIGLRGSIASVDMARMLFVRTIESVLPRPGAPYEFVVPAIRHFCLSPTTHSSATEFSRHMTSALSLFWLAAVEYAFAFAVPAAMRHTDVKTAPAVVLRESLSFAIKNASYVLPRITLVCLAIGVARFLGSILPGALLQGGLWLAVTQWRLAWLGPWADAADACSTQMINDVFWTIQLSFHAYVYTNCPRLRSSHMTKYD